MDHGSSKETAPHFKRYAWILVFVWTVTISASLWWNIFMINKETLDAARIHARSAFKKDIVYRRWNSMHGGVYVPSSEGTPPNPYLSDISERDIETPSGKKLTLINPAYMTRQVFELGREEHDVLAHITSLKPLRPENAPDPWEINALKLFEKGEQEFNSVEILNGKEYLRLMKPLLTEKSCLTCHARQGYKENDIRGGISVSVPMDLFLAISKVKIIRLTFAHVVLWLLGVCGLIFGYVQIQRSEASRLHTDEALRRARDNLEKQVRERTNDLTIANAALQKEIEEHQLFIERYLDLYENAPDMFISVDVATATITRCNQTTAKMLGYSKEELIGHPIFKLYHPDSQYDADSAIQKFISTGELKDIYLQLLRKDGGKIDVSLNASAVRDADGRILRSRSVLRDITAIKQAEEVIRRNEYLLNTTGAIAKVGGWEFDAQTLEGTWTDEVSKIHDLEPSIETNVEFGLSFYKPESREKIEKAINEAIEQGKAYDLELEMVTAKGNHKWVRTIGLPVKEGDRVVKVRGSFQDITEQKRAAAEIQKLNDELHIYTTELENRVAERTEELRKEKERAESADRLKSVFLSTMSHELRTPLNSIIGFTGILLQSLVGPLNDEQNKQLQMVQDSGRHLLRLINDVLDISKIESGQFTISHEKFDIRDVVTNTIGKITPSADKGQVAIHTNISSGVDSIIGDHHRVEQILINLVGNAVKFTPAGGEIRVTVESVQESELGGQNEYENDKKSRNWVRISVTDTGIGIKPEDMDKLFKPFQQIDTGMARKFEGTGLGLSICKRLVELMGGEINAESGGHGKGSRFVFTLPIA